MASGDIPSRPAESGGHARTFRPPPDWPTPPAGWEPPAGWRPDSSWPPPPAGWQFWGPAPRRKRPGVSFYVKSTAGILTFAATIAGAFFAFRSQPSRPTTDGWVTAANAACDRDIGPVNMSFFDALLPSSDQAAAQNSSTGQNLARKLRDMIAIEGSLSKLNGDLAALPAPQDSGAPAVRAVIRSGNALVDSMDIFSSAIQADIQGGTVTAAQNAAVAKDASVVLAREYTWRKAIGALGLRQCPFWTAHPAPPPATLPPPTPPPAAPSLTAGESQLIARLNGGSLTNCVGRPDQETGGVVAAVNCQNIQSGPTKNPLIVQLATLGSAQAWFQDSTAGYVNHNDCAGGHELGQWNHDGVPEGPWGCAFVRGDLEMVWVSDASLIGVIADGSDGPALYAWWTRSGNVFPAAG
jgi:hypothetical protein